MPNVRSASISVGSANYRSKQWTDQEQQLRAQHKNKTVTFPSLPFPPLLFPSLPFPSFFSFSLLYCSTSFVPCFSLPLSSRLSFCLSFWLTLLQSGLHAGRCEYEQLRILCQVRLRKPLILVKRSPQAETKM